MSADAVYIDGLIYVNAPSHRESGAPSIAARGHESGDARAFAVASGRILAVGSTPEILRMADSTTTVVHLGGRRVIPGLIDGHMHAVRAGANWDQELHWTDVTRLTDALDSVRDAAARATEGAWIRVVGGWHPSQFVEQRVPTRQELDAVSAGHPVYVQALYEEAVLNTVGLALTGFDLATVNPPGAEIERAANGEATGVVRGMGAFSRCLAAMGTRSAREQEVSTAAMLYQLHQKGLTGIVDPGGFAMPPEGYDAVRELWRHGNLTMRMRLFASAVDAGREGDQLREWMTHGKDWFDDEMIRLTGIGEVVHYGCHDFEGLDTSFTISESDQAELLAISRRTAKRGWPMHIHAVLDSSITTILDCWEKVNQEFPLRNLRFTVVHADAVSPRNIDRLCALGAGVVVDDHLIFKAALSHIAWGDDAIRRAPPLGDLLKSGIAIAAGTDANRASSYNPWLVLWWLVAGESLDGKYRRSTEHLMSRQQALDAYTRGGARLSFDEDERGHLGVGALADFAVLNADYFSVAVEHIRAISSDLTVVGGQHVYSSGAVADATDDIHRGGPVNVPTR